MNAHEEKIAEIEEEICRITIVDIDEFGDPIRLPKRGKKSAYEAAKLRLRQAVEANEAYGRAMLLLR